MAKKQWVNLPQIAPRAQFAGEGADEATMGRSVYVVAELDKKDAATTVTLEVVADGGNAPYSAREKRWRFDHDKVASTKVTEAGKAKFKVNLSCAGLDKFKFKLKDAAGTEKELPEEIETHRKLYYQVIGMTTVTPGNTAFVKTDLKKGKRGIELVEIASKGDVAHFWNLGTSAEEAAYFAALQAKYDDAKDPYCFVVGWADCLAEQDIKGFSLAGVRSGSGLKSVQLTGYQLWLDITPAGSPDWYIDAQFQYVDAGVQKVHAIPKAELTASYGQVDVNTAGFPAGQTGEIVLTLVVATGFSAGWSFNKSNVTVNATRGPRNQAFSRLSKDSTVLHETGHKIGMLPNGLKGGLDAQGSLDKRFDDAIPRKHCKDTGCTMWWDDQYENEVFCSACDESIRRLNLDARRLAGFRRFY